MNAGGGGRTGHITQDHLEPHGVWRDTNEEEARLPPHWGSKTPIASSARTRTHAHTAQHTPVSHATRQTLSAWAPGKM